MQTPIAQTIALAIYGNARIRGLPVERFFPGNSTCSFCDSIRFLDEAREFAQSPDDWVEKLLVLGATEFLVEHTAENRHGFSDRMTVGFVGGGGHWLIRTKTRNENQLWEGRWRLGDRNHPQKRIWEVAYVRFSDAASGSTESQLEAAIQDVKSVLTTIAAFARRQNLDYFADCFERSLAAMQSPSPLSLMFHSDVAPGDALPLDAQRLLAAAETAWVFGGMGSWNDLGFAGPAQSEYEQLSDQLYEALTRAALASANASAPSASTG